MFVVFVGFAVRLHYQAPLSASYLRGEDCSIYYFPYSFTRLSTCSVTRYGNHFDTYCTLASHLSLNNQALASRSPLNNQEFAIRVFESRRGHHLTRVLFILQ